VLLAPHAGVAAGGETRRQDPGGSAHKKSG